MLSSFVLAWMVTAVLGAFVGAGSYRLWLIRDARQKKRIPPKWQLQARPLFSDVERTVWRWLRQVFFDHQLLLKIPVIRFLSPQSVSQGHRSHELLKGIYCSFTVCTADGKVIGCIDVPGIKGLKASHRDLKRKLFEECGIAYAVLSANNLPTLEGLRASFLGASVSAEPAHSEFTASVQPSAPKSELATWGTSVVTKSEPTSSTDITPSDSTSGKPAPPIHASDSQAIDMLALAAARNILQDKLERNRKTRIATIESLSASMGIVDDNEDKGFVVTWHDSFILSEQPEDVLTVK